MKRGKLARGAGAWLALIVLACGETNDGGGSGGGGDIPLASLPTELARVYCTVIEQCLGAYLELVPISNCQQTFQRTFENTGFAAINAAVDAGVVTYDPHQARVCVDDLLAQGCGLFSHRNPASCDAALAGKVALGSACSIDSECVGDAYCDQAAGTCPGVCAARRDAGADCTSSEACASGLICNDLKCSAPAEAGHACEGASDPPCRTGLVCVGASDTTSGTCAEAATLTTGKLGEKCDPANQRLCDPSLACVIDTPLVAPPTFSCKAKSASGGTCARGVPEPCPSGEYCNVPTGMFDGGTCTKLPKAGEACLTGDVRLTTCADELVCASGTCRARNVNGATCTVADECYSSRCSGGTCVGDEFCTP